jgi:hypothetical protein
MIEPASTRPRGAAITAVPRWTTFNERRGRRGQETSVGPWTIYDYKHIIIIVTCGFYPATE